MSAAHRQHTNGMAIKKDSALTKALVHRIACELRHDHQYNYEAYLPLFDFIEDDIAHSITIVHERMVMYFIYFDGSLTYDVVRYAFRVLKMNHPVEEQFGLSVVMNIPNRHEYSLGKHIVQGHCFSQ